jgi:hypothetical protein
MVGLNVPMEHLVTGKEIEVLGCASPPKLLFTQRKLSSFSSQAYNLDFKLV